MASALKQPNGCSIPTSAADFTGKVIRTQRTEKEKACLKKKKELALLLHKVPDVSVVPVLLSLKIIRLLCAVS